MELQVLYKDFLKKLSDWFKACNKRLKFNSFYFSGGVAQT